MSLETRRQQHYRAAASSISLGVLVGIVAVIVLGILFVHLANEVVENEFFQFDKTVSLAFHATASGQETDIMRVVTDFGSPYLLALTLLSLIIGGITVWQSRRYQHSGIVVALIDMFAPTFALGGALVLMEVVKLIVNRPRPNGIFFPPLVSESGPSFPSGHAISSVAFYGMCAFLLARPAKPWLKAIIVAIAIAIIGAIAYSRVYLGVHYPTDILGSVLLGSAWLLSVIIAIQVTENHLRGAHALRDAEGEAQQSPLPASSPPAIAPTMPMPESSATMNEPSTNIDSRS